MNIRYPIYEGVYRILTKKSCVPLDEQQVEWLARLIIGQTVRNIRYSTDRKERITAPGGAVPLF